MAEIVSSQVVGHREIVVREIVKVRQSRTTPADPETSKKAATVEYDDVDVPVQGTLVYPLALDEEEAKRRAVIDFGVNFGAQIAILQAANRGTTAD